VPLVAHVSCELCYKAKAVGPATPCGYVLRLLVES
jgi:hypothetical protein